MSALMNKIYDKARDAKKHIVLPEGEEQRVIEAVKAITSGNIAKVTLLGNRERIMAKAGQELEGAEIIDPQTSPQAKTYAELLYSLRKDKGMTREQAEAQVKNPLYFGALMLKNGDADGMVAGSINATADVLRPALQLIKTKKGISTVSSCFIMVLKDTVYGDNGVMVFGDCAVVIDPDAEQLASIAASSAETAKIIAGIKEPNVAMLSFSTKGSGKHPFVDKVAKATEILKERYPELNVDGELQADAAIVSSVGALKSPGSKVAGKANVLIFPDLQSGNIGYKLVQRLAGAEAIGPICQGLNKPVNDLSRGCSVEDIIGVVAITALQAD